jgi:hypothetical protein
MEYKEKLNEEKAKIRKHYKDMNKYISEEKIHYIAVNNMGHTNNDND